MRLARCGLSWAASESRICEVCPQFAVGCLRSGDWLLTTTSSQSLTCEVENGPGSLLGNRAIMLARLGQPLGSRLKASLAQYRKAVYET